MSEVVRVVVRIDENTTPAKHAHFRHIGLPPFSVLIFCAADVYYLIGALKVGSRPGDAVAEHTNAGSPGDV